ncbi:MAG TPA: hypothetical protein VJB82_04720 [Candidatus Peribacterales bacterium]|nr:hypothetical protein [Candidatus Peribacterales bacterium]
MRIVVFLLGNAQRSKGIPLRITLHYTERMWKIILGIACVLLLVCGFYWWSIYTAEPEAPPLSSHSASSASVQDVSPPVKSSQGSPRLPPPRPPTPPTHTPEEPVTEEEEQAAKEEANTAMVRQFIYNLRTTLVHIGRMRAIADGKYEVEESEVIPSLQSEMDELVSEYAFLEISHLGGNVVARLASLFEETQSLIESLSSPPTLSELTSADTKRRSIQKRADDLFLLIQKN